MQSTKSKIILALLRHSHLFQFRLKRKPFDPSLEGIKRFRERTEKAAALFGKLPAEMEIMPLEIAGRYAEWLKMPGNPDDKAILYFHGGMYTIGSPQGHRQHVSKFVQGTGINALVFDYRLAPEHPFPAALDDSLAAYDYLLEKGFQASNIVMGGDSAGGGLCLSCMLALKEKGKPLPAAAAVMSPWTDLALTGKSYRTNAKKCLSPEGSSQNCSIMYAGAAEKTNPLVSPLYGDLTDLPPIYISAGSNEILLDDSVAFAEKAQKSGVELTLEIGEGMCHCYPAFGNMFRESKEAMAEMCRYLRLHVFR